MNKAELVDAVAKATSHSKTDVEHMLNCTLDCVKKSVKKGDEVRLVGFGTFLKVRRKARTGRNPQTGATIKIAASNLPKFRPGKEWKELVK